MSAKTKSCRRCKQTKGSDCFYASDQKSDGLFPWCKECVSENRQRLLRENPEKYRGKARAYKSGRKEQIRVTAKGWRIKNPDKQKAIERRSWNKNKEKIRERNKRNKKYTMSEKARKTKSLRNKKHREANKDRYRSYCRNRIAMRQNAPGIHTHKDIADLIIKQGGRCFYCGELSFPKFHVDHMLPLSKGGSNDPKNLCIACQTCNVRKNAMTVSEFFNSRWFETAKYVGTDGQS